MMEGGKAANVEEGKAMSVIKQINNCPKIIYLEGY